VTTALRSLWLRALPELGLVTRLIISARQPTVKSWVLVVVVLFLFCSTTAPALGVVFLLVSATLVAGVFVVVVVDRSTAGVVA
jgi:hypothetical protein